MKNFITGTIASISTLTPEISQFDPTIITEGSSLLVQVVTAIIAILSFFKGLKKKPQPKL